MCRKSGVEATVSWKFKNEGEIIINLSTAAHA